MRYAGYFQDDWKATQRLTINLGCATSTIPRPTDVHGLWRSLSFQDEVNGYPDAGAKHPHAVSLL